MKISFHGAAREVTGSCHLLETDRGRLLLDCGLIQGGRELYERNTAPFPFDPQSLDCVVLSHAHIDHSGRLPRLVKEGFRGPIYATRATVDLCEILLADSGRIHEEDARWKIKRLKRQGKDASWVRPLYTEEDALAVLEHFVAVDFDAWQPLEDLGEVRFVMAGHILGAAIVELQLREGGKDHKVTFSGDLGVDGSRLLSVPTTVDCPEVLIMESTYGNRERSDEVDRTERLYDVIRQTADRGGRVIVPAFAVGRTQEVLARLNDLVESGRLSGLPVFVDSPMAIAATRVFAIHPQSYSEQAKGLLHADDEPLHFEGLHLTPTVAESKAIKEVDGPCVIISASGMCTAGRIKHHLKNNIADSRNTILFVGYQAAGTLGRLMQDGVSPVKIFGDWYPVRAELQALQGFSAHADRAELLAWFGSLQQRPACTYVVHGEEKAAMALRAALEQRFEASVEVPELNQGFELAASASS